MVELKVELKSIFNFLLKCGFDKFGVWKIK